jgi:hypothetical protein
VDNFAAEGNQLIAPDISAAFGRGGSVKPRGELFEVAEAPEAPEASSARCIRII